MAGPCAESGGGVLLRPRSDPIGVSMFRTMSGFKTQYHYLTLVVVSESTNGG
jgi:hypothetical protein